MLDRQQRDLQQQLEEGSAEQLNSCTASCNKLDLKTSRHDGPCKLYQMALPTFNVAQQSLLAQHDHSEANHHGQCMHQHKLLTYAVLITDQSRGMTGQIHNLQSQCIWHGHSMKTSTPHEAYLVCLQRSCKPYLDCLRSLPCCLAEFTLFAC